MTSLSEKYRKHLEEERVRILVAKRDLDEYYILNGQLAGKLIPTVEKFDQAKARALTRMQQRLGRSSRDLPSSRLGDRKVLGSTAFRDASVLTALVSSEPSTLLQRRSPISYKFSSDIFLTQLGKSGLLVTTEKAKKLRQPRRVRVYMDGLDEVPQIKRRRQILEMTRKTVQEGSSYQVVITTRDYVRDSCLCWLPKIYLSPFDDDQIRDLVNQ